MTSSGGLLANGNTSALRTVVVTPPEFNVEDDEMRIVRVTTPLPDLLPRSFEDIEHMRKMRQDAESGRKYVAPRVELSPPYVNDDECDEFEDATINTTVEFLSQLKKPGSYLLRGPSVEGKVSNVFEHGMLYKIITSNDAWHFYNDTEKYEMRVRFRFGAKSELQPGDGVEIFAKSNKEIEASLTVYPGETRKLIEGKVNGFKCMAKAVALSNRKRAEFYGPMNGKIQSELEQLAEELHLPSADKLEEEQLLEHCTANQVPYIDCSFRPCDRSLSRPDVDVHNLQSLPWRRPCDYIPKSQLDEVRLFRRSIAPSHVTQGKLGDSYFTSAVACLAEMPDKIRDLFRHPVSPSVGKAERRVGAYWVTLNCGGWWRPTVIDDYLPAYREGPEYAHCAVDFRRLWVALLEKAYAKIHHSYSNIASGDPLDPLQDLTGFPITSFDTDWESAVNGDDKLFKRLVMYNKRGYITVLYTPPPAALKAAQPSDTSPTTEARKPRVTCKELGLQAHSGYSVLQVKCFEEMGLFLLQVRNPWSTGEEWKGRWSKSDKLWEEYPSVQSACFPSGMESPKDDNMFWLQWSDALNVFAGGGVCHVRNNWYDYRIRGNFVDGYPTVCLEINVSDPVAAYIVLSQEEECNTADGSQQSAKQQQVQYAALLVSVSRHSGKYEKMECASDVDVEIPGRQLKFNFSRSVALQYTFEPEGGPYFVIPRIHDVNTSKPYVIGLLLDTYAGNGIQVEFKAIHKSCKVFQNMPTFSVKGMLKDVATEYQIRNSRRPTECVASELVDERLKEFDLGE